MLLIAAISLLVLALIAIPIAIIYTKKIKADAELESKGIATAASGSTQSFLPYEAIRNSIVELGNDEYCAYIKCNSINYTLKTDAEQEAFEQTFIRFIEGISFPFAFYVQTRNVNFDEILKDLQKDIQETMKNRPGIASYANQYYQELSHLDIRFGSMKQKSKYIIVTYKVPSDIKKLTEEQKYEYALDEIYNRASILCQQLAGADIKAEILKSNAVYEMIYQSLHKEDDGPMTALDDKSVFDLVVDGKSRKEQVPAIYDRILLECINKLKTEVAVRDDYPAYKAISSEAIEFLDKLRNNGGAYYKDTRG